MKVFTTKGEVDRALLTVADIVTEEENARVTATEWRMDGELVRRDVHVNILVSQPLTGEQGSM